MKITPGMPLGVRVREIERLFAYRWGETLPATEAGRDGLFVVAQHIAQYGAPERHIPAWAALWCPWLTFGDIIQLINWIEQTPLRWTADALAERLGLDDATRTLLAIKTIGSTDVDKEQRIERRNAHKLAKRKAKRHAARALRPVTATKAKPWVVAGISRSSWYAKKKLAASATP